MTVVRPLPKTDQRTRIRDLFRLPSLGCLITAHRLLSRYIPSPGRLAAQVVLADERCLNLSRPLVVNRCLSALVALGLPGCVTRRLGSSMLRPLLWRRVLRFCMRSLGVAGFRVLFSRAGINGRQAGEQHRSGNRQACLSQRNHPVLLLILFLPEMAREAVSIVS